MGLLGTEKYKPTLFVGLGGNGGKIVNMLSQKLHRHEAWSRVSKLVHFLSIDTNKDDLDKLRAIPSDCRFLISAFDAQAYVARKRGQRELDPDPLVTQWVPGDYQFRSAQGAGAGQIRLESRLRLYYNLEEDRASLRRKVMQLLQTCTSREDPWRDNEDKVVRVVIFGSVAGGTGSGGFLPMAYLLRDLVLDAGWGRPLITSFLTLPTAFLDKVRPQLHPDIMANGYAALKELEFLTRQLDYAGGAGRLEFHYDPGTRNPERTVVENRPFAITYLIDRPSQVSIERYEAAVADAAFLQMFSPLLGEQAGAYDNYEKRQKQLALGNYTVHYGTLGVALLQLPRGDVIRYAGLRYAARAFRDFLCFGATESGINYNDPSFQKLDQREKNRRVDEAFRRYVEERAAEEESRNEKGVFFGVKAQLGRSGTPLRELFRQKLDALFSKVTNLTADIQPAELQAINPGNPSIRRAEATLRKQFAEVSSKAQGELLQAALSELKTGRFFRDFFGDDVNPLAQRLFLVKLLEEDFIAPNDDIKETLATTSADFNPADPAVQRQLAQFDKSLSEAAQQGVWGKLTDRDNSKFTEAKKAAKRRIDQLVLDAQNDVLRRFWRHFETKLREKADELAGRYRELARLSDDAARQLEAEAERFRRDPGSVSDSDVAQYYLDAEVLKDDRQDDRLWHVLYAHRLEAASWKADEIFQVVQGAFREERGSDGVMQVPDAGEICTRIRSDLQTTAREIFQRTLEGMGLDLASGLDLEQRYIAVLADGGDVPALQRAGKLDDAVAGVAAERVRLGLLDRLRRLNDQTVLLAHIDTTKSADDPSVTPADIPLVGLSPQFDTEEAGSLGRLLRQVSPSRATFVQGWNERDSMVLYRALLGIPLYFFRNIQTELHTAYRRVRDDKNRSYPLHIEASWEAPGLPDLDPLEMRRAAERQKAEAQAQLGRNLELQAIREFALASIFGRVMPDGNGWAWSADGVSAPLGADRAQAFRAFQEHAMRDDLVRPSLAAWNQARNDRASCASALEDARRHEQRLTQAFARAAADGRDAEMRHLKMEREALGALITELGA